jgi:hypothetical protein
MCVNYRPPLPEQLDMVLGTLVDLYKDWDWPTETWKDYLRPSCARTPTTSAC